MDRTAAEWRSKLGELADKHAVPGASLAVLVDGVVHEAATGTINRGTGIGARPETLFQIGSITKVWTATLVLGLADEGLLSLDAPVSSYIPELRLADPEAVATLTVRHLLNHTSGLPGDFFPDTGRGDDCLERYLEPLSTAELTHPVGALYSYSNSGFSLAGLVVERVTGTTWDEALRARVVEPLGLSATVTLPEDALLHRTAVGHVGQGEDQRVTPRWVLPRACGPSGLIASRASDVIAFARLHLDAGTGSDGRRLLSRAAVAEMQQLSSATPGGTSGRFGTGLGWGLGRWGDLKVLQHDGSTIGQAAALRVLPDHGVAIALLTNGGSWTSFRDAVLTELASELVGADYPPPPVPSGQSAATDVGGLVGEYRSAGAHWSVSSTDGGLTAKVTHLDPLEVLASGDHDECVLVPHEQDVFLVQPAGAATWSPLLFLRDDAGRVAYLHFGGRAARRARDEPV